MLKFELSISEKKMNQLQSKDLKKSLAKMVQAVAGVNKNQWQYAINLHNIVVNEYYKPDYKNVPELAEDLRLDKGTVSRMVSAVKIMVNTLTPKYHISFDQMPYSKAASLATIKNLDEFIKVMGIDLLKVTSRELEQAKRDYKAMQDNAIESKPEKEQAEKPEKEQAEKEDPVFTGRVYPDGIAFSIDNKNYVISLEDLKKYRVK